MGLSMEAFDTIHHLRHGLLPCRGCSPVMGDEYRPTHPYSSPGPDLLLPFNDDAHEQKALIYFSPDSILQTD